MAIFKLSIVKLSETGFHQGFYFKQWGKKSGKFVLVKKWGNIDKKIRKNAIKSNLQQSFQSNVGNILNLGQVCVGSLYERS